MPKHFYNPELPDLSRSQGAALAQLVASEGFEVFQLVVRTEVDKFIEKLINVDTKDAEEVLERHRVAKVAGQLYEGVISEVNGIVNQYIQSSKIQGPPVDPTEGMLDLGPHASRDEAEVRPREGDTNEF